MRLLIFSLAASAAIAASTPPTLRLGNQAHPERYAVQMTLDPDREAFEGQIEIALTLREPTSLIWLNGTNLEVQKASIASNGTSQEITVVPGGEDFIGLSWQRSIPAGAATLTVTYHGKLSDKNSEGIFRVKQAGRNYIFTQFEAVAARRAFPCFDEPSFKVPWQVTLHVPNGDLGFSNAPVQSETPDGNGRKTIRFQTTKPLPSYLVALAVGPFEIVQAGKAGRNQVPIRVIVPQGRAADASYAAKIIPELFARLESYFEIPYPYEKLDSVAVPLFQGTAMENAGLITYDDPMLLSKPDRESIRFQRTLGSVAAHEMAHQWFGDLVTMAWWNDTWLNEAFATWMSSTMLKQWKPEWHAEIDDLRDKLAAANVDGLASARRITQPVESKSDIANAFDDITYLKGGAVIGMFEASVGPEKFRKGVQNYLRTYAFKNGRTEDFLAALTAATTPATGPAFRTFLDQPGIPEVTVAIRCSEGSKPVATVTQKRSQPLGSELEAETWQIPVCLKFGMGAELGQQCLIAKTKTSEVTLSAARGCPEWVLPNAGANGYYRVNYPGDSLRRLLEHGDKLSVVERASVLGDALALTLTGELPAAQALGVVALMVNSPERELVEGAQRIVNGLGPPTLPEALRANQARFIQKTFGPRARGLGWIGKAEDSEDTRLLREGLLRFVVLRGEDEVLASAARDVAIKWLKTRNSLDRGMVRPVLAAAAFEGDRTMFDRFRAAALESKDQEERQTLLIAMGSFRSPDIAQLALQELLKNDFDLRLSSTILFGNMTTHRETRRMPFEFIKAHFDELIAKAPTFGDSDFGAVLPLTAQNFCSAQEEQEVNAFFGPRVAKFTGGPRNLAQTLETIRACTARKAKQEASLRAFYQQF